MITVGWPQMIYLALSLLGTAYVIANHGKPKTGKHNGVSQVIALLIVFGILYWGGFFNPICQGGVP